MNTAKTISVVTVVDPDSMNEVEVIMFKHNESGSIFGVDSSYLDQCFEDEVEPTIQDPFNEGEIVILFGL